MILAKRLLHRMQRRAVGRKTFDSCHIVTVRHHRQRGAGLHSPAVEVDDAGTTLRCVAADMGPGQAKMLAQELDEQRARIDLTRHRIAVHDQ
jgi:hypothetical protein